MSKTLHQFGRVLFDELEQIAVRRRSGFASLKWANEKLLEAQRAVEDLRKKAADTKVDVSSLRKTADVCARQARVALAFTTEAAEAIGQLAETMRRMLMTAEEARKKIKSPWCDLLLMSSVKDESDIPTGGKDLIIVAAVENVLHFRMFDGEGEEVVDTDEKRLTEQAPQIEDLRLLLVGLWPPHEPSGSEKDRVITAVTSIVGQTLPTSWGSLRDIGAVLTLKIRADWEERMTAVKWELAQLADTLHKAQLCVKEIRDQKQAEIHEARFERICRMASGLKRLDELKGVDLKVAKKALKSLVKVADRGFIKRSIEEQLTRGAVLLRSRDPAYKLGRQAGQFDQVRSAFREMAEARADNGAVGKLDQLVAEQSAASRHEIYDVVEDAARKSAMRMETVGLAFSGGGIRSATFNLGFLQGAAALGLLKQFDYLSTVSGGGYIGAWFAAWVLREGGHEPEPPAAEEKKTARAWFTALVRRDGGRAGGSEPPTDERDRKRYEAEVSAKRQRTPQALENVQKQLNSSRARQASAVRRWASPTGNRRLPPKPTLEDEPAPVHHLREHSNYLTPKIGVLSIDTWTMVSIYFRNLFLNQFIVLPMLLAVIALPRLVLFLFTHSTSDKTIALARGWLERHPVWPLHLVLGSAIIAMVLVPKLIDFFAGRIIGRLHARIAGLTILSIMALGMMALPFVFTIQILPLLVPSGSRVIVRTLVRWELAILLLLVLAAVIGRKRVAKYAESVARGRYGRTTAWEILSVLIFGTAVLAKWLPTVALDFVGSFVESLTGDREWLTGDRALFLGTFFMAWFGFNGTYRTLAQIREIGGAKPVPADHGLTKGVRWWRIWEPLLLVPFGVSLWFAPPEWPYYRTLNVVTFGMALVGFWRTYQTLAEICRRAPVDHRMTKQIVWLRIVVPLTCVSLGVSLLFARPGKPFFECPFDSLRDWFNPKKWDGMNYMAAVCFGGLVGLMRLASSAWINWKDKSRQWTLLERVGRAWSAFWSGLISGVGLAAVLSWLAGLAAQQPGGPGPVMMSFGPALVMVAIGAGSAIDVGLIGGYRQEDMREWRASLGAYLMIIGTFWAVLCVLSIYGPLFLWWAGGWAAWAVGAGLVVISVLGAMAGRSERTDGVKTSKSPLEYLALIAPAAFIIGLVVAVSVLVAYLQDVHIPIRAGDGYDLRLMSSVSDVSAIPAAGKRQIIVAAVNVAAVKNVLHFRIFDRDGKMFVDTDETKLLTQGWLIEDLRKQLESLWHSTERAKGEQVRVIAAVTSIVGHTPAGEFLHQLSRADQGGTWAILLLSLSAAVVGFVHANINLFGLNAFYANRLVRCYLGASRPREASKEGRPNFAPTNSLGPVRQSNPITGFDFNDDFPLHELAIARSLDGDDLVVNYRGPYHLINTAMNLVAGDELAWQERMAESFVLSPLYCGSKTTGYRPATKIAKCELEDDEVEPEDWVRKDPWLSGYGDGIRLGTAISVSGAAASPNAGYHSSPLVTILMTILNARLGLWLGNPAKAGWRRSGPGFAFYFFHELFSRTTNKDKYVYLSDGGHFENLGAYELVRRRCRYIVVCDAGADPALSFWDLGSLVRKCRQDFGIRIEIDISPLLKKEGTPYAKWHCAVGQIHYEEVDAGALPAMLLYIKPSLSGDEPSDVRNYRVDHPAFPHESTANQFFNESQFESYRELGEHIARDVFGDAVRDAGPDSSPAVLFSTLRRRWVQASPNLDKGFLESMKPFVKIHEALRTDPKLEKLSHKLYRELEQPPSDGPGPPATPRAGDDRAHRHAVIEMLQAVQNAWIALNLDAYSAQPLNRGWMNVFRRWVSSGIFQAHWPAVRGEFSEGFIRFCESELNLRVQEPKFSWLKGYPNKEGRTITLEEFEKGLNELDKEFLLEWPRVILPEISDRRVGLAEMFEHACKRPPRPEGTADGRSEAPRGLPMAVLIMRGKAAQVGRPTSEPSSYGVILAWRSKDDVVERSKDDVVELLVWLRGAYGTLGIGEAIEKTIGDFKEELEALKPNGYALRTRYPSDDRSRGKQRWQRTLWTDFFQNQGFHRDDSDTAVNAPDTLIYRYDPR